MAPWTTSQRFADADPDDELYAIKVEGLLRICACIWGLRRDVVEPA